MSLLRLLFLWVGFCDVCCGVFVAIHVGATAVIFAAVTAATVIAAVVTFVAVRFVAVIVAVVILPAVIVLR